MAKKKAAKKPKKAPPTKPLKAKKEKVTIEDCVALIAEGKTPAKLPPENDVVAEWSKWADRSLEDMSGEEYNYLINLTKLKTLVRAVA